MQKLFNSLDFEKYIAVRLPDLDGRNHEPRKQNYHTREKGA